LHAFLHLVITYSSMPFISSTMSQYFLELEE